MAPPEAVNLTPPRFRSGKHRCKARLLWSGRPGQHPIPFELISRKCALLTLTGRYEAASLMLSACVPKAESMGDRRWAASLSGDLARALNVQGEAGAALPHAERARGLMAELKDDAGLARVIHTLAGIYSNLGQGERAHQLTMELLDLADRTGQAWLSVQTLFQLREELGMDAAADRISGHLERARRDGDKLLTAMACFYLGDIRMNTGRWAEAEVCNIEQYRLARETGDRMGMSYAIGDRGLISHGQGRYREAIDCYLEKLEISEAMGDFYNIFEALVNIGDAHAMLAEFPKALEFFSRAEAHTRRHQVPHSLSKSLYLKAKCLFDLGDLRRAGEANREALEIAREIGYGYVAFNSSLLEARLAAAGDPGKALSMLEALLPTASEPEEEGDVRYELFRLTGDPGHRSEALRLYRLFYERRRLHCTLERIRELEGA
ncbi:MAG TPA: hypothetical protein DDW31_02340 [candidate division Zixibacteria bacterium]|nr:hypothetical protein [candidate division Zixibacteria bacterium]